MNKHSQNGIAVISAMLLAAVTTVIVGNLIWQQHLVTRELENIQNSGQAMIFADAAVHWSRTILAEDALSSSTDHTKEIWATPLPPTPIEGGSVSGYITDMQQFINLNTLASAPYAGTELMQMSERVGLPNGSAERLMAYLSAHQALTELENLQYVPQWDAEYTRRIKPYIAILPTPTPININTTSAEVLAFAVKGLSLLDAQGIIASRNEKPFTDIVMFKSRLNELGADTINPNFSVQSQYFLVTCIAQFGQTTLRVESLLYRGRAGWPEVIWKRIL